MEVGENYQLFLPEFISNFSVHLYKSHLRNSAPEIYNNSNIYAKYLKMLKRRERTIFQKFCFKPTAKRIFGNFCNLINFFLEEFKLVLIKFSFSRARILMLRFYSEYKVIRDSAKSGNVTFNSIECKKNSREFEKLEIFSREMRFGASKIHREEFWKTAANLNYVQKTKVTPDSLSKLVFAILA